MKKKPEFCCRTVSPFLKWAGGKRWLTKYSNEIFPDKNTYQRYFEPFLGSGAVFFHLMPRKAFLSDVNDELIRTYNIVKNYPKEIEKQLKIHQEKHSFEHYYKVRDNIPKSEVGKAARFIYLNRACWNGLYRVNNKGMFNVPKGTKDKIILDTDCFDMVASLLKSAIIESGGFEKILSKAKKDDFVFVDPPYTVTHNKNGFIKYNERLFSWDDQVRLCGCVKEAVDRGAKVLVTNAAHEEIRKLYKDVGEIRTLSRSSILAASSDRRGKYEEFVIKCGY